MKKFSVIQALAEQRKGGKAALKSLLPKVISNRQLAKKPDDRFLAMMAKTINQAGFNWTVIENKWPQFEEAFFGFDINKLANLSPEQWEAYVQDTRVVRNWQKIKAVMNNVYFIRETAQKHGSFASFIANWPSDNQIGLMAHLKKYGSRLGGQTAQWFMRYVGKDCFVLSKDVVMSLQDSGLQINDTPNSKRDLVQIQTAFNDWHQETNLPYAHLSKIAAYSIGSNYENENIKKEMNKFSAGT